MYMAIEGGRVAFGTDVVLENFRFEITKDQKIAVVGRNGCGKSTLLKLISGCLEQQPGVDLTGVTRTGDCRDIGYLEQMAVSDDSVTMEQELEKAFATVLELKEEARHLEQTLTVAADETVLERYNEVMERYKLLGGHYYRRDLEQMVKRFGFTQADYARPLSAFSGGQRTRIAFMRLLLSKPAILLLDEPTNHLDMETVEWLEGYLAAYPKAVVVVSHDQMFLDRVAGVVYEIERGKLTKYPGNYSHYTVAKQAAYEQQKKAYEAYIKEKERLGELVERFRYKATKAAMAQSKIKAIERMEEVAPPEGADVRSFFADLTPMVESGGTVLTVKQLTVGYDRPLFTCDFVLQRGRKLGVIGGNGLGKSTLLKTLMGKVTPLSGTVYKGNDVQIGYFDQQMAAYTSDKTVLDDYWDTFPHLTQTRARSDLGAFVFRGEEVFKPVSVLSGGEKVRLCLCKILKRRPNFLLLDEPTNHTDIVGKQALEEMLKRYSGTLVCVSHDRYFIREVCDCILEITESGAYYYPFGFEEYETRRRENRLTPAVPQKTDPCSGPEAPGKKEKRVSPLKELGRVTVKLRKLEEAIALAEEEIAGIKDEMDRPENASDYQKMMELGQEIDEKQAALSGMMEEWEQLSVRQEELTALCP